MNIVLEDFTYKGEHFSHEEISVPNHIGDFNKLPCGKVEDYVREYLDLELKDRES